MATESKGLRAGGIEGNSTRRPHGTCRRQRTTLTRWARNFETGSVGGMALVRRVDERGVLSDGTIDDYALRARSSSLEWDGHLDARRTRRGLSQLSLRVPQQHFAVAVLGNASDLNSTVLAFGIADIYLRDRPGYRADPVAVKTEPTAETTRCL